MAERRGRASCNGGDDRKPPVASDGSSGRTFSGRYSPTMPARFSVPQLSNRADQPIRAIWRRSVELDPSSCGTVVRSRLWPTSRQNRKQRSTRKPGGQSMAERHELLELAGQIVSAHVESNSIPPDQLPRLIQGVYAALSTAGQLAAQGPKPVPAVPVKGSISQIHITCLDCGKQFATIKRHLMTDHKLTPDQYRQRWNLLPSYPLVAPNYSKTRSALAKKIGLGRKAEPMARRMGKRKAAPRN
jgi:predicted transcriptional regulator